MQIGITGVRRMPRPARLRVEPMIGALLAELAPGTLVSALAEGADRVAAHAALAMGWRLHAILPFAAHEYERDFAHPVTPGTTPDACLAEFRHLIAAAAGVTCLGLPHAPDPVPGYEAAGLAVIEAAELMLAVWDGTDSGKRGGTSATLRAALAHGRPVLWLRSDGTGDARVIERTDDLRDLTRLPPALPWLRAR